MITDFEIDGFKSLRNFSLSFNKGLNVLIGPNGAGKTNICQALGLVAAAAQGPISRYIMSLGSALSAFSLSCSTESTQTRESLINVTCKGDITHETAKLRYVYAFSIGFDKNIRINKEKLRLFKKSKKGRFRIILGAERKSKTNVAVHIRSPEEIGPRNHGILGKRKKITFRLEAGPLTSFLPFLDVLFFYCHLAREDMRFSRAWNIDPNIAKKTSDLLEPHKMLPDGKRLANAIHDMYDSKDDRIDQINEFMSRILPGYGYISPSTAVDGTRTFSVIDTKGIPCPAHCLSDGTIKTLALLIGILGERQSTTIIEEPENYLHPWACQLLIDFFRDYFTDGVCILTTHSETILNTIKPKEIIIIENIDGFTVSHRLSGKKDLINAIRTSGFGTGYHYIAGSLGGTPE